MGLTQVVRRIQQVTDPDAPLTYEGRGGEHSRQAASCISLTTTMTRAGVGHDPEVRPLSITAWAGRRVLAETDRIDEVARRLGNRSLDRTARLIDFDWAGDDG